MYHISTRLPKGALEQRDICKGCTLGKYTKSTFHNKDIETQVILERVHSYVYGPFSTASMAKHRYYVIFIDDFSCKCYIFFMSKKDQTFSKFFEFKGLVEKDIGRKVKAFRSDNGGEYVSNEFKKLCSSQGIRWELVCTP